MKVVLAGWLPVFVPSDQEGIIPDAPQFVREE